MVLFVCVQNSARSQIAEEFFKKYCKHIVCSSAGTKPADKVNPYAVQVMKEAGLDISENRPKIITNEMIENASIIINMGCMDNNFCPSALLQNKKMEDWSIEDPAGKSIEKMREIRDQIERKVRELISDLEKAG
jgi:protein-tyrosine-phosphatase